jgi:hypothetical protein
MRTVQKIASICLTSHLIQPTCFVREFQREESILVEEIREVQSLKTTCLLGLFPGGEDVREQNILESTVESVPV